jgi:hypothetical protein
LGVSELFEELCGEAFLLVDFCLWGEGAVFGVGGELLDLFGGVFVVLGLLFG